MWLSSIAHCQYITDTDKDKDKDTDTNTNTRSDGRISGCQQFDLRLRMIQTQQQIQIQTQIQLETQIQEYHGGSNLVRG